MPPKRCPNRLLVLCASINDVTAWPFWKFLQMKKIRGVTDMALLAFNSDGGSFEARIDGDKYQLKNYAKVRGYQHDMFESFVHRWHDPGRSYFVYGGHGMGDYVELEENRVSLQAHELAAVFGHRTFEAILFDACFMANLDCAYHLRRNTRYIGACEGYMWEPDTALDYHVFNTHNASAMSRFKDPLHILRVIQADYCGKAARGDFTIMDTTHAAELRRYVAEHVMPRVYDRAAFFNLPQQERLQHLAEAAMQASIAEFGHPGGDVNVSDGAFMGGGGGGISSSMSIGRPRTAPSSPSILALSAAARPTRRQRLLQAIQFEHALYPSEVGDKQLLDLKSYLTDMQQEEHLRRAWEAAALGPPRRTAAGRRHIRSDAPAAGCASSSSSFAVWRAPPSRVLQVDRHGRVPAAAPAGGGAAQPLPVLAGPHVPLPSSVAGGKDAAAAAERTVAAAELQSATPAVPAPLLPTSPLYKGSAQEGLDLFHQVVVSHTPPKAAGIYAAHLGGLSITVHEYSAMSRPVEPWVVSSRKQLKRRAKEFLKNGALSEVAMEFASPVLSATALSLNAKSGISASTGASPTRPVDPTAAAVVAAAAAVAAAATASTSSSTTPTGAQRETGMTPSSTSQPSSAVSHRTAASRDVSSSRGRITSSSDSSLLRGSSSATGTATSTASQPGPCELETAAAVPPHVQRSVSYPPSPASKQESGAY